MMRNVILTVAALTALTLGPAFAQSYELDITAQLRAQGYQNITLSHTWLGRTRIVALLGSDLREIVLDPNTGEILRDLSRTMMAEGGSGGGGSTGGNPGGNPATNPGAAVVASSGAGNGTNGGTSGGIVRTTSGVAAATALDGQVTTSATVGISTALGGSANPASGGPAGAGQTGLPFQILGPAGGP